MRQPTQMPFAIDDTADRLRMQRIINQLFRQTIPLATAVEEAELATMELLSRCSDLSAVATLVHNNQITKPELLALYQKNAAAIVQLDKALEALQEVFINYQDHISIETQATLTNMQRRYTTAIVGIQQIWDPIVQSNEWLSEAIQ